MPIYTISNFNPQTKFCEVSAVFEIGDQSLLELSIPRWRPARYSLQNYAELIQEVKFLDENNRRLSYTKLNIDTWIIQTHGLKQVKVFYSFYSNQFEAGGSFIDQDFVLLNPINCLMYDKNGLGGECSLEVLIDDDFGISGAVSKVLKQAQDDTHETMGAPLSNREIEAFGVVAQDFHHLVDTPLLLAKKDSSKLKKLNFEVKDLEGGKIDIELVIYGENKLDLAKVESDFKAFISEQVKIFKTFAVKNYTFLCILPDFSAYHGVEHQHSSVNIFGQGFIAHKSENYKQFLGICCHEFFHHWNIKSIRPKELNEYDYTREQLFMTGYVAEGFTTYYGDLILYRAGLLTLEELALILSKTATTHIQNFGRFRASMHESSLDLWLDGYKAGIPNDKVNIYIEGCLLALILDGNLRKAGSSLDVLLEEMYKQFGHQHIGYTEYDLIKLCNEITGTDFTSLFQEFYGSKIDLTNVLSQNVDFLGLKLEVKDSAKSYEADFGFKITPYGEKLEITKVYPNSSSYQKLALLDQIIALNGKALTLRNFDEWFEYFEGLEVKLQISRKGEILDITLDSFRSSGLKVVNISELIYKN